MLKQACVIGLALTAAAFPLSVAGADIPALGGSEVKKASIVDLRAKIVSATDSLGEASYYEKSSEWSRGIEIVEQTFEFECVGMTPLHEYGIVLDGEFVMKCKSDDKGVVHVFYSSKTPVATTSDSLNETRFPRLRAGDNVSIAGHGGTFESMG